jgi:hypothetical protein
MLRSRRGRPSTLAQVSRTRSSASSRVQRRERAMRLRVSMWSLSAVGSRRRTASSGAGWPAWSESEGAVTGSAPRAPLRPQFGARHTAEAGRARPRDQPPRRSTTLGVRPWRTIPPAAHGARGSGTPSRTRSRSRTPRGCACGKERTSAQAELRSRRSRAVSGDRPNGHPKFGFGRWLALFRRATYCASWLGVPTPAQPVSF